MAWRHSTLWLLDVTATVAVSMVMVFDLGAGLDIRYDNNIERDNLFYCWPTIFMNIPDQQIRDIFNEHVRINGPGRRSTNLTHISYFI